jgi:hypothetical protein
VGLKGDLRYDWETMKRLITTGQHLVTGDEVIPSRFVRFHTLTAIPGASRCPQDWGR